MASKAREIYKGRIKAVKIVKQDRLEGKYNICFEDDSILEVNEEDYLTHCLYERDELSRDEIENIALNNNVKKARTDAIKFVSYKIRSCLEVRQRLQKLGYDNTVIETAIESLLKDKYLNDFDYAGRYARTKIKLGRISRKQLETELLQKGISDSIILSLEVFNEIDEYSDIMKIIYKKYSPNELLDQKMKLKAMKYLYSKGYGTEIITNAVEQVIKEGY